MEELLGVLLMLAATIGLPCVVLRRDRKRLAALGQPHPWNTATFACAVGFFQLLSVPAYYWVAGRRGRAVVWIAILASLYLALFRLDS
jgi:hypothetical protein